MTTDQRSIARADCLYKMLAATGFLIDGFAELEQLGPQPVFKMNVKNAAIKFRQQLLQSEQFVVKTPAPDADNDKDEAMDQMFESTLLMDRLLTLTLVAGRQLTPDARTLLDNEVIALAAKYGLKLV